MVLGVRTILSDALDDKLKTMLTDMGYPVCRSRNLSILGTKINNKPVIQIEPMYTINIESIEHLFALIEQLDYLCALSVIDQYSYNMLVFDSIPKGDI